MSGSICTSTLVPCLHVHVALSFGEVPHNKAFPLSANSCHKTSLWIDVHVAVSNSVGYFVCSLGICVNHRDLLLIFCR